MENFETRSTREKQEILNKIFSTPHNELTCALEAVYQRAMILLGDELFHATTGKIIINRVERLVIFIRQHPTQNIKIEVNNNWSNPPKPSSVTYSQHIGGTSYEYQVWAVVRK